MPSCGWKGKAYRIYVQNFEKSGKTVDNYRAGMLCHIHDASEVRIPHPGHSI